MSDKDGLELVDDLSILEVINLLLLKVASYDIVLHVPSDIPVHNGFIRRTQLVSQRNISFIINWGKL